MEQVKELIDLGESFNEGKEESSYSQKSHSLSYVHMIWRNKGLSVPLKRKLVQLMIWPIISYGSEIYLNVFEISCYRRMLCILWTEHVTHNEVFNRVNTKSTLLDGLPKSRHVFHRHLVKLGTPHAIFIGTTIVVRRDDGRRSSNDPLTPERRSSADRSHHRTVVG